jgi:hypothetical protein
MKKIVIVKLVLILAFVTRVSSLYAQNTILEGTWENVMDNSVLRSIGMDFPDIINQYQFTGNSWVNLSNMGNSFRGTFTIRNNNEILFQVTHVMHGNSTEWVQPTTEQAAPFTWSFRISGGRLFLTTNASTNEYVRLPSGNTINQIRNRPPIR